MLGQTTIASVLGAAPDPRSDALTLKRFVRECQAAGLAVLLIEPGTKTPLDMRSAQERNKQDNAAREDARAAGRPDFLKARALAGAHLATTDKTLTDKYIDAFRKKYPDAPLNFAVEVGRSGLIVVDCDTTEQREAFLRDVHAPEGLPPTVRSPGSRAESYAEDGAMAHYDGGHYWFTVTEGQLHPRGSGSLTMPGGYAILSRNRYVLIPPSERPEGRYELTGREYAAPQAILDHLNRTGEMRADHAAAATGELTDAIDAWSASIEWSEILAPEGWTLTSRTDQCGCEVWTAPGYHASPKSATIHDAGCGLGQYSANAPMHIWTDNPGEQLEQWIRDHGGSKTLSKLQAYAVFRHKGNVGTAVAELGLLPKDDLALEMGVETEAASLIDGEAATSSLAESLGEASDEPVDSLEQSITWDCATMGHDPTTTPGAVPVCVRCGSVVAGREDESAHIAVAVAVAVSPDGAVQSVGSAPGEWPGPATAAPPADDLFGDPLPPDAQPENDTNTPPPPADRGDLTYGEPQRRCVGCGATIVIGSTGPGTGFAVDHTSGVVTHWAPDPHPAYDPAAEIATEPEVDPRVLQSQVNGVPVIAPFSYWRDVPAPEYIIDGLIENQALTALVGEPGSGKSAVALDMACHIVSGRSWQGRKVMRQRVLYLPGEGLAGAAQRVKAWEEAHNTDVGDDLLFGDSLIQLNASKEAWQVLVAYIIRHRVGMIMFDTFARMSLGIEENSATDVGRAIVRFDQVRKLTGAGVMIVHHTGKNSTSARGSSALNGALDTELLVRVDHSAQVPDGIMANPITLWTSKQKNAARMTEPMPLLLTSCRVPGTAQDVTAALVTGPSGKVGDLLDTATTVMRSPEPVVETAIRLRDFALRFPQQGCTRGEFATGVVPDDFNAHRADTDRRWRLVVAESVDKALDLGLLVTLTGTPSGTRYVPGTVTPAQARAIAAQQAITD